MSRTPTELKRKLDQMKSELERMGVPAPKYNDLMFRLRAMSYVFSCGNGGFVGAEDLLVEAAAAIEALCVMLGATVMERDDALKSLRKFEEMEWRKILR